MLLSKQQPDDGGKRGGAGGRRERKRPRDSHVTKNKDNKIRLSQTSDGLAQSVYTSLSLSLSLYIYIYIFFFIAAGFPATASKDSARGRIGLARDCAQQAT